MIFISKNGEKVTIKEVSSTSLANIINSIHGGGINFDYDVTDFIRLKLLNNECIDSCYIMCVYTYLVHSVRFINQYIIISPHYNPVISRRQAKILLKKIESMIEILEPYVYLFT